MGRLFWKIFLAIFGALLSTGIIAALAVWLSIPSREERPVLEGGPRASFVIDTVMSVLQSAGVAGVRHLVADWGGLHPETDGLVIVGADGIDVLGHSISPRTLNVAREALLTGEMQDHEHEVVREAFDPQGKGYLIYMEAIRPVAPPHGPPGLPPPDHGGPPMPWPMLAGGLIASVLFSAMLAAYLSGPLRHVRNAFASVASGDLDIRIAEKMGGRRDEIADLGHHFDLMVRQLEQLMQAQTRLLHDVSHELRSPLARLQIAIDLARQDPVRVPASLDRIERESARLDQLVGEILSLSRIESTGGECDRARVDLSGALFDIAADARYEAQAASKQIELDVEDGLFIDAYGELLERSIENVVRNAIKFTGTGTTVTLTLARHEGLARLTVRDRGPGVPESMLHRIFEPFFRTGHAGAQEGAGLGLAIAARAMQANGGVIYACNHPEGGLCLIMEWPESIASLQA